LSINCCKMSIEYFAVFAKTVAKQRSGFSWALIVVVWIMKVILFFAKTLAKPLASEDLM
jgi:hypothetical protein